MAYNSEKMAESLNVALGAIFQRHQPPISDCVSMLGSAVVALINGYTAIEDRQELVSNLCEEIKENVKVN